MGKLIFLKASDRRRYCGVLVIGEIDCRHGFYVDERSISLAANRIGGVI
jgi:hypothetical protein